MSYRYRYGVLSKEYADYRYILPIIGNDDNTNLVTIFNNLKNILYSDPPRNLNDLEQFYIKFDIDEIFGYECYIINPDALLLLISDLTRQLIKSKKDKMFSYEIDYKSGEYDIIAAQAIHQLRIDPLLGYRDKIISDNKYMLVDGDDLYSDIVNLGYIYRTFDFENNFLILTGW